MFLKPEVQRTLADSPVVEDIHTWIEAFLIDRKARGCAKGTLVFYQQKMKSLSNYCDSQVVSQIHQITPTMVRNYLLYLLKIRGITQEGDMLLIVPFVPSCFGLRMRWSQRIGLTLLMK